LGTQKITKESILEASLVLLKRDGENSLSARNIAKELKCSTQPIYCNFRDMKEIRKELITPTFLIYNNYVSKFLDRYKDYKAYGMAYIKFASEEKELFRYIYLKDTGVYDRRDDPVFMQAVNKIAETKSVDIETAFKFHLDMSIYTYGLAVMQNLGSGFSDDELSEKLTCVYNALSKIHLEGK